MGLSYAEIELSNPSKRELKRVAVKALADTGAYFLCIPSTVAAQLELETLDYRVAHLAYGSTTRVAYVGPLQVNFENRSCFTGALVMGEEVLLGAIPMEDMDLVVEPLQRRVRVNPAHPNFAESRV